VVASKAAAAAAAARVRPPRPSKWDDYTPGSDEHGPRFYPGPNQRSEGGDFKERAGAYARTEEVVSYSP